MILRTRDDVMGTEREVKSRSWVSRRLLLQQDGMGFSFHETIVDVGAELAMAYRHHLESVYCVAGEGEILEKATGVVHPILSGTLYALNQHDAHVLRAKTQLTLMCVFNPPLHGQEVHDATGAYPLVTAAEQEALVS